MGFSLNNLTLFGLVLAIGIVVDDAIVVLENIERMIAKGYDARTATIKAMEEITGPIMAITLVLCSVFVPCCFIGGITGQFFRQFAVTIAVSTIISAVNAMTMTPSRAVLIFKTEEGAARARAQRGGTAVVDLRRGWAACSPSGWRTAAVRRPDELAAAVDRGGRSGLALLGRDGRRTSPRAWRRRGRRLVIIRPVNAVLGWFFRGFNRVFDGVTGGLRLDGRQDAAPQRRRAAGLRRPARC